MQIAESNLLRTCAKVNQEALKIATQMKAAQAMHSQVQEAEANSLRAGKLLNMAILRWLRTL